VQSPRASPVGVGRERPKRRLGQAPRRVPHASVTSSFGLVVPAAAGGWGRMAANIDAALPGAICLWCAPSVPALRQPAQKKRRARFQRRIVSMTERSRDACLSASATVIRLAAVISACASAASAAANAGEKSHVAAFSAQISSASEPVFRVQRCAPCVLNALRNKPA